MIRSALEHRLDDTQQKTLMDYAICRVKDLRSAREQDSFTERRLRAENELEGLFTHRLSANIDEYRTIHDTDNCSAQLVRSVHRFLVARLAKDFFGSEPWLSAQPEGPLDGSIAAKVEKHAMWKLKGSNWKTSAKEALGVALALGEVAIKTTYRVEEDCTERLANILCEPSPETPAMEAAEGAEPADADNQPPVDGVPVPAEPKLTPVVTADGDYIFDTDESSQVEKGEGVVAIQFTKDPAIEMTEGMDWKEHAIEEKVRTYANVDMRPIHWKDVAWPLNAPSIEDADFVAHTYQSTPEELTARFDPDGDNTRVQEVITKLKGENSEPKAEGAMPKEAKQEGGQPMTPEKSLIKITECYFKRDVMGKGRESRIFMVIAEDAQQLIWIDYVASISPRSQWPIHLIPFNRVSGRGYGRGLFEIYEMAQKIVDEGIASIRVRNKQHANPTKIWNPHLTQEGEEDEDLKFSPGQTYTAKDANTAADDILKFITMPDLDERTWDLVEMFEQFIQVESGVTNANQGDMSSLPSNTTATGINSMLESSSVIHSFSLEEFRDALEPALKYAVELIYFRQDADETYEYFEGDAKEILSLSDASTLRQMPINVRILLQRAKRMELRQAALDFLPHAQGFFALMQANPMAAKRLRPLYEQAGRGFDIDGIDTIFPTAAEIDEMTAAAQPPPLPGAEPSPPEAPAV